MSKVNAIQFLEQLRENEITEQKIKRKGKFEDSKSMAQALSEVAAEMGKEISPEDFIEALKDFEDEIRQKTDSVISDIEGLADEELENVSGGLQKPGDNECRHEHNGNCGENDACIYKQNFYACNGNYNDVDCTVFNFCNSVLNFEYCRETSDAIG